MDQLGRLHKQRDISVLVSNTLHNKFVCSVKSMGSVKYFKLALICLAVYVINQIDPFNATIKMTTSTYTCLEQLFNKLEETSEMPLDESFFCFLLVVISYWLFLQFVIIPQIKKICLIQMQIPRESI